jgi:hypothetical protein
MVMPLPAGGTALRVLPFSGESGWRVFSRETNHRTSSPPSAPFEELEEHRCVRPHLNQRSFGTPWPWGCARLGCASASSLYGMARSSVLAVFNYNWPYRLRTARHSLPTRLLFAARVAPHRSRLSQFKPPERSQNFAAAGRHGTRSFISRAPAAAIEAVRRNEANIAFFMDAPSSAEILGCGSNDRLVNPIERERDNRRADRSPG